MSAAIPFRPDGFEFFDKKYCKLLFVQQGPFAGWLAYQHPDRYYWITLRKATPEDLEIIEKRMAVGN